MPCDGMVKTPRQRKDREETLKELDAAITSNRNRIKRNAKGEVSIEGWAETSAATRGKWCEGCTLRVLSQQGSWLVRTTLAQQGITSKPFVSVGHTGHKH